MSLWRMLYAEHIHKNKDKHVDRCYPSFYVGIFWSYLGTFVSLLFKPQNLTVATKINPVRYNLKPDFKQILFTRRGRYDTNKASLGPN